MSNKTISINPSLFSLTGSKSKKNRGKPDKSKMTPLISPSVLKNKLLKRIKEHKTKETQDLANNKRKIDDKQDVPLKTNNDNLNFSDEFTDSINYLQTLSKQKRVNEEKRNNEILNQKRREELERKTIRNYHSIGGESPFQNPTINIDLPEELMQPVIIQPPIGSEPFQIQQKNEVPYGILKGGTKPSYREWTKTQRNNVVTNPNASLIIQGSDLSSKNTDRENRLKLLKEKIKNNGGGPDPMTSQNLIKPPGHLTIQQQPTVAIQPITQQPITQQPITQQPITQQPITQQPITQQPITQQPITQQPITQQQNGSGKVIATKHVTKKTIKRKYTLGRSKIKKTVAVLIKDRGTRKMILTAQKDLKRKNINDVKTYLREHNLIKTGSNAPNDVLRKLYESAMLSGEITNSNPDTLLHNFSKDDKEL
jgi:hypothetical protein